MNWWWQWQLFAVLVFVVFSLLVFFSLGGFIASSTGVCVCVYVTFS